MKYQCGLNITPSDSTHITTHSVHRRATQLTVCRSESDLAENPLSGSEGQQQDVPLLLLRLSLSQYSHF